MQIWAVGQMVAVEQFLDLFQEPKYQTAGVLPELAFFDCHACHRPMKNPHWAFRESSSLQPGTIHLNDANLLMLRSLLRHISPAQGELLHAAMRHLHKSASVSLPDARKAALEMRPLLAEIRKTVVQRQFSIEDIRALITDLVAEGTRGDYNDYGAAEQAAMALAALFDAMRAGDALSAKQSGQIESTLKQIDEILKDENAYDPGLMINALKPIVTYLR